MIAKASCARKNKNLPKLAVVRTKVIGMATAKFLLIVMARGAYQVVSQKT